MKNENFNSTNEEPENNLEQNEKEILDILENAFERGAKTILTVEGLEGKPSTTNIVTPWSLEKGFLTVETEDGMAFDIEISRIKIVEIVE